MRQVVVLAVLMAGCATTAAPAATERTMPDPVAFAAMPESPDATPIPPEADWAVAVEDVEVSPGDRRDGILLSFEKAQRAALLRVAYDELRALYGIDIRTWSRERGVYEEYLRLADQEVATWRTRAERSWWETNGDEAGLVIGLVLGVGLSLGVGAIIAELAP